MSHSQRETGAPRGVALLGCAHPHVKDALETIARRKDVRLAAVWDHDEERARSRIGDGAPFSSDLDAVLTRGDVEAAFVLSETKWHDELVPAALRRKLPLFVEKPLATSGASAARLAAASSGALFHVGYFLRDVPAHAALREHLRAGRLGRVLRASAHFGHPGLRLGWLDRAPWLRNRAAAGYGGFGDLGVHLIDLLGWLAGEAPRLLAADLHRAGEAEVEEHGMALVRFASGWTAALAAGWNDPVMRVSVEIIGTEASVRVVDGAVADAAGSLGPHDFPPPCAPSAATALALLRCLRGRAARARRCARRRRALRAARRDCRGAASKVGLCMAFDVIVVGSGFGGSICAARLAQRGLSVLILERGPWWGPAQREHPLSDRRELPRGLFGVRKLVRNVRSVHHGRRSERLLYADGLLEAHLFDHLRVITSSGVGGGSHVYTAILEEPSPDFFEAFPPEITAAEMRPYFDRVREMMRPVPVPSLPDKNRAFEDAVRAAGLPPPALAPLAIAFGDDADRPQPIVNAAGVVQCTSTWRSDALVGCEDRSKTTLDLTYLPFALRHGAELRPLCEVTAIEAEAGGYAARYVDHRSGADERVCAPRLVLAAGGLNTQRLLFAARERTGALPALPPTLGRRFSSNGDMVALLWRTRFDDLSRGPSIGGFSRMRDGSFLLGEVGLPVDALPLPDALGRALRRSLLLLCMGRDASDGTVGFDGTGLVTSLGRQRDAALYAEMARAIEAVARHYEPRRLVPSFLAPRGDEGLFTVHPLGGCSIGQSPEDGFTDHVGQVFGHPGLFVADGSLYPRSPGIPPSLTIAALAERQAALMA